MTAGVGGTPEDEPRKGPHRRALMRNGPIATARTALDSTASDGAATSWYEEAEIRHALVPGEDG